MSFNNRVGNKFRCFVCDGLFSQMWDTTCNKCRTESKRHSELINAAKINNSSYQQKLTKALSIIEKQREALMKIGHNGVDFGYGEFVCDTTKEAQLAIKETEQDIKELFNKPKDDE